MFSVVSLTIPQPSSLRMADLEGITEYPTTTSLDKPGSPQQPGATRNYNSANFRPFPHRCLQPASAAETLSLSTRLLVAVARPLRFSLPSPAPLPFAITCLFLVLVLVSRHIVETSHFVFQTELTESLFGRNLPDWLYSVQVNLPHVPSINGKIKWLASAILIASDLVYLYSVKVSCLS